MDHDQPEGGWARLEPEPPSPPRPLWSRYAPPTGPPPSAYATASVTAAPAGAVASRPSTALAKPGDIRSILARVEPAVVRIDVTANPDSIDPQSGTGTGFIIGSDGVIVTNAHVTNAETSSPADELVITLDNGDSVRGRVVGGAGADRPARGPHAAHRVPRCYTQTVTPELERSRDLHTSSGACVALVKTQAGAERAGVRRGDVVIAIDGTRVNTNDDVVRIVRRHRPGDTITIVVLRNNAPKTFKVTLGDLPNA